MLKWDWLINQWVNQLVNQFNQWVNQSIDQSIAPWTRSSPCTNWPFDRRQGSLGRRQACRPNDVLGKLSKEVCENYINQPINQSINAQFATFASRSSISFCLFLLETGDFVAQLLLALQTFGDKNGLKLQKTDNSVRNMQPTFPNFVFLATFNSCRHCGQMIFTCCCFCKFKNLQFEFWIPETYALSFRRCWNFEFFDTIIAERMSAKNCHRLLHQVEAYHAVVHWKLGIFWKFKICKKFPKKLNKLLFVSIVVSHSFSLSDDDIFVVELPMVFVWKWNNLESFVLFSISHDFKGASAECKFKRARALFACKTCVAHAQEVDYGNFE